MYYADHFLTLNCEPLWTIIYTLPLSVLYAEQKAMAAACKYRVVVLAVTVGTILLSMLQADAHSLVMHACSMAALLLSCMSMTIDSFCLLKC